MTSDIVDRLAALAGERLPNHHAVWVCWDAVVEILSLRGDVMRLASENRRLQGEVAEYDATAPTGLEYRGG